MSLIFPPPPEETKKALAENQLFPLPGILDRSTLGNPRWTHPLFTLGLHQIARGEGLAAAKQTSWRFLVSGQQDQMVAVDVSNRPGVQPNIVSVWRGLHINNSAAASDKIVTLPDAQSRDFEVRVLRIPALRVEAFWLKPPSGDGDLVVPFQTLSKELQLFQPYPAVQFMEILRRMAQKELQMEDSAKLE